MIKELFFLKNKSLVERLLFFFFSIYPISFLTGNFLINLFSIIIFKFSNLNISTLICLLLILIIGVSHGALDHLKGKKLLTILNIKKSYIFYFVFHLPEKH